MPLKSRKKKLENKIYSKPVLILLVIVFILLINSVAKVYRKETDSKKYVSKAQKEHTELTDREDFLRSEIDNLNTIEGKEIEIREKFNVAKDGEKVIIIVGNKDYVLEDNVDNRSWFTKAWKFIKGLWKE